MENIQQLWLAVLNQVRLDEDFAFFSLENEDFLTICDLAGVDKHQVLRQYGAKDRREV